MTNIKNNNYQDNYKFDPELLSTIVNNLIRTCFQELSNEISDNLLMAEITYLYRNKIYDDQSRTTHFKAIDDIANNIDLTIANYYELMTKDIYLRLNGLISKNKG